MQLTSTLAWLVDAAGESPGADRLLAELGAHLIKDGLPLAGGALTLAVPHPLIARRTWLWRADGGEVIEALGFAPGRSLASLEAIPSNYDGRRWLAGIAPGPVHEDIVGLGPDGPLLGWVGPRPFTTSESEQLRQAARFAAAPLAALAARATLSAALEAYLGRRSAARVLAAPLRRGVGETIQAALLYADLRGFTALSESHPPVMVITALDAWFDRIAGAVHAFGGEVLNLSATASWRSSRWSETRRAALAMRRCARCPPLGSAWRISIKSGKRRACRLCRSAQRFISARCCGAISAPRIA